MQTSNKVEYVSIAQAAIFMGVHIMTVRSWVRNKWIPAYRVGPKLLRIHVEDIRLLRLKISYIRENEPFGNLNNQRASIIARSLTYPSTAARNH